MYNISKQAVDFSFFFFFFLILSLFFSFFSSLFDFFFVGGGVPAALEPLREPGRHRAARKGHRGFVSADRDRRGRRGSTWRQATWADVGLVEDDDDE